MENNDQNHTNPDPQDQNPQCDPTSNNSSCCSTASGGSKGFKTVILIVVLLLGAAVASKSLMQDSPKSPCCPGQSGDTTGSCPKGVLKPDCGQAKTIAGTEAKPAGCSSDSKGCLPGKSSCDKAKTCPNAETKPQGCSTGEKAAGSPCCPSATLPDASPKTCPK
jgi:hypothetical protein